MQKKILTILAHCDDEVICGWPVLQDDSNDRYSLTIAMQEKGQDALRVICKNEGINFVEHTMFRSRFSENAKDRLEVEKLIQKTIVEVEPDIIFTHNEGGEYGHIDHIFLNGLVTEGYGGIKKVLVSNIEIQSECWPKRIIKQEGEFETVKMDAAWWDRGRIEYEKRGCWTTNKWIRRESMQQSVRLYACEAPKIESDKKLIVWLCDTHEWAFANAAKSVGKAIPQYEHKLVVLKFDKVNVRYLYTVEDHEEINRADLVMAMTPSALLFTERRKNTVTRLSGMRST